MKGSNQLLPQEFREEIRKGSFKKHTSGFCSGFAQANLVVLPHKLAFDFMLFAQRNPKPCPILDVTDVGDYEPRLVAPGADIRSDLPKYKVYEDGKVVTEVSNIESYWRDDFVAFLLGCSFSFESALLEADIPIRHIEAGTNVPMYITNLQCEEAGAFSGPMVVSMRPIPRRLIVKAVQVTSRFPAVHGAPVQIGNPVGIGINELEQPDFGDPPEIKEGDVPVFWACGVTPQVAAREAKPEIMITHSPGCMFITDVKDEELAGL
ncbi:putative hydro-lyase [Natroniella acetigena]|uniref:putative hydro-lyase n=1 Tax=Natroniella acetigena TaxID=52004 RepID=UPI00200B6F6A|nr:putative hydro-lyase [Natroniella acetigena]MCK8827352.1 putative hydro-lyase [Natroniella acetigena]